MNVKCQLVQECTEIAINPPNKNNFFTDRTRHYMVAKHLATKAPGLQVEQKPLLSRLPN